MAKPKRAPSDTQLPHLETFSKAAELASFTRAAEALCMTQAAVSQHIGALERGLGVVLFRRHAGRVELTDAGRCLYDYAQRILGLHAEARCALGTMSMPLAGELRVAASTIPAQHFLMALLAEFRQVHPQIHVVADVGDSAAVISSVENGKATVGLAGRKLPTAWAEYELFATDRLVLIVPSKHAWKKRTAVTVEQLRSEPLVLREPGSGTRACLERALATRNLTLGDFNVVLELGTNEAIKDAVFRNIGVAVLSIHAVQTELTSRRLRELSIEGLDLARELYIVTDHRRALPAPARTFLDFLRERKAIVAAS